MQTLKLTFSTEKALLNNSEKRGSQASLSGFDYILSSRERKTQKILKGFACGEEEKIFQSRRNLRREISKNKEKVRGKKKLKARHNGLQGD